MPNRIKLVCLAAVLAVGVLSGCSPQSQHDANADADNAGASLKREAQSAEKSLSTSTAGARKELANDATSAKVKEALMSANGLDTGDLKVDTIDNVVTLHGMIPTKEQKKRADTISKGVLGPDYKLIDKLVITPN